MWYIQTVKTIYTTHIHTETHTQWHLLWSPPAVFARHYRVFCTEAAVPRSRVVGWRSFQTVSTVWGIELHRRLTELNVKPVKQQLLHRAISLNTIEWLQRLFERVSPSSMRDWRTLSVTSPRKAAVSCSISWHSWWVRSSLCKFGRGFRTYGGPICEFILNISKHLKSKQLNQEIPL